MRHYTDEEEVEKAANAAGYKDIYRKTLLTVTEMEKLMSKKIFNQVLGNLVYKPPGKPALVPESDKRTAMDAKTTAKEEFTKCEPEER